MFVFVGARQKLCVSQSVFVSVLVCVCVFVCIVVSYVVRYVRVRGWFFASIYVCVQRYMFKFVGGFW